jgi:hypothetical protein
MEAGAAVREEKCGEGGAVVIVVVVVVVVVAVAIVIVRLLRWR